jgi:Uridylate kinase
MRKIVLKIGGHLLERQSFKKYSEILNEAIKIKKDLIIVVGGGDKAREFIKIGRTLGLSESFLDYLGILVSHINALIFHQYLSKYNEIYFVKDLDRLIELANLNKAIICGGFYPTISTTTVACMISELVNGELLYATNVEGIYDKDPKNLKMRNFMLEFISMNLLRFLKKIKNFMLVVTNYSIYNHYK